MSASMSPTRNPSLTSAMARLTASVVLPTPPLPDPTAMMFATPGSVCGPGGVCACAICSPLSACVRVPLALAFLLRLFTAPPCVMVAALVLFRLQVQRWNPDPALVAVDGDKSKVGRRNMTQCTFDGMFHPHFDAHFHGSTEGAIEGGLQDHQISHVNGRDKVDMVHGSRDHVRSRMAIGRDRAHQVDVMHKPAA